MKAFERCGWTSVKRKGKNTHFILKKAGHPHAISIPNHGEVKRALLQAQIKRAGLSEEQYLKCFRGEPSD